MTDVGDVGTSCRRSQILRGSGRSSPFLKKRREGAARTRQVASRLSLLSVRIIKTRGPIRRPIPNDD